MGSPILNFLHQIIEVFHGAGLISERLETTTNSGDFSPQLCYMDIWSILLETSSANSSWAPVSKMVLAL